MTGQNRKSERVRKKGLSIRAYAAHRAELGLPGSSPWAVQKALRDGRISKNSAGKIDPAQADADWLANTEPGRGQQTPDLKSVDSPTPTLTESKAKREQCLAEMARLDLLEREGELVNAEAARRDGFETGRKVLDRILALPPRLGPVLASLDDPREITARLDAELREILEKLVEGAR